MIGWSTQTIAKRSQLHCRVPSHKGQEGPRVSRQVKKKKKKKKKKKGRKSWLIAVPACDAKMAHSVVEAAR